MKIQATILLLLLVTISFAQKNNTHFKTEIDFGNGSVFATFLDVSIVQDQFTITSPKNADVRMFGGKAKLGRLLGKSPKKGIIITIKGQQEKDSLLGETKIPMFGKLKFKGVVKNDTLAGELMSDDTTSIGTLQGVQSAAKRNDYSYLYPIVLKTIQDNIYSRAALQSGEWVNFQEKVEKLFVTANDDIELFLGFNILTQRLPFTHVSLFLSQVEAGTDEIVRTPKSVVFEEKNNSTAYLLIKNFGDSKNELAAILPTIVANKNYTNLIVDFRDNPGGGIDAAFEFAKYITEKDMEVGYFVTNKLQYAGYQADLFGTLPALQPKSTHDFTEELKTSSGVKLIFKKPSNAVFEGNLFVLTNGGTGSTCEPIVYALKKSKRAIIIGEKTYGGMLAACPFDIAGKYHVMLPIADFYAFDGVRIDRVGVSPDVEVKSADALNKALELIAAGGIK